MTDGYSLYWKSAGVIAAIYFVISACRRKKVATDGKTVIHRSSLAGRAGGALMAHAVLSTVSGVLGFNVVMAFFSIVCAVPLLLMGAEVHLPEFVKAWPRSIVARVKGTFIDAKEGIKAKISDGKEALPVDEHIEPEEVSPDSDEYWGGPPDPNATAAQKNEESRAFDALPPARKIAIIEAAKPVESVPPDFDYDGTDLHKARIGRSSYLFVRPEGIARFCMMWEADGQHTHGMDARVRAHLTQLSIPSETRPDKQCFEQFSQLPPGERYAAYKSAWKLPNPLPDRVKIPEGFSRDGQLYRVSTCPCWFNLMHESELLKQKEAAFEEMRAADIAAAESPASKLVRAARERAEKTVADLKGRASQKAKLVAADMKVKGAEVGRDLKQKAGEGVKEGAKGLFWKAFGY